MNLGTPFSVKLVSKNNNENNTRPKMVSIIAIVATVVLALLTGLFLLGRAELAKQPKFEGTGPEDMVDFEDRVREYHVMFCKFLLGKLTDCFSRD